MTQEQYNIICKTITMGVPILANELLVALDTVITNSNKYIEQTTKNAVKENVKKEAN